MQAPRLEDVQAQVVAWHNSHPLARRIQASQVHSIGGVLLPFASAQPLPDGVAPLGTGAPPAADVARLLPLTEPDTAQATVLAGPQAPEISSVGPAQPALAAPPASTTAKAEAPGPGSAEPTTQALDLDIEAIDFEDEGESANPDDGDADSDELLIDIPDEADQAKPAEAAVAAGDDEAEAAEPAQDAEATEPDAEAEAEPPAEPAEDQAPEGQTEPEPADPDSASDDGSTAPDASADDGAGDNAGTSADNSTDGKPNGDVEAAAKPSADEVSPFADLDAADAVEAEAAAAAAAEAAATAGTTPEPEGESAPAPAASAANPAETDLDLSEPATLAPTLVEPRTSPAQAEAQSAAESEAEPLTPLGERLQAARDKALAQNSVADPGAAPDPEAGPQSDAMFAPASDNPNLPRPAPAQRWWQRWLQRLRPAEPNHPLAVPALRSLFSRDFIWPMTIGHVARWSRRHGSVLPVAPDEWPLRVVETNQRLLQGRQKNGFSHPVMLHVITAAIGVGDRRIRLLMDAKGNIIGPRAYDSRRVGLVASMGMVLLVAAGAGLWHSPVPADESLASAEAAASQPLPASAALADAPAKPELHAEPAPTALADAPAADPAAMAEAPATALEAKAEAASAPAHALQADLDPAKAPSAASAPLSVATAAAPLGQIRPALTDSQKQQAQLQSRQARQAAAQPAQAASAAVPAGPVYAVVTSPEQRDLAERSLARIASAQARMPPPALMQSELMQADGQWRAVWWPFDNRVDAERARVMLLARGLRAEVVSF